MNPWIPVVIGLIVNGVVVGIAFGGWRQTLKDLKRRMGDEEKQRGKDDDKRGEWENRMEDKQERASHEMIPECSALFSKIEKKLSRIEGQVDLLVKMKD
jgi:hypothetical protein